LPPAEIVNGGDEYVTVPMQGSGTFAVEAMLTTLVPKSGKVLLLINGAYGHRARKICDIAGRKVVIHETPEDTHPISRRSRKFSSARLRSPTSSPFIARRRRAFSIRSRRSGRWRRAMASGCSSTP